ncbi:17931_t:CDS:2, partial [Racocetra persica]
ITGLNFEGEIITEPTNSTNDSIGMEQSISAATSPMKLGGSESHPTDGWELDDFEWSNNDGWDDDWDTSRPSPTTSTRSVSPIQKLTPSIVVSKEDKAAELSKKREERRQDVNVEGKKEKNF